MTPDPGWRCERPACLGDAETATSTADPPVRSTDRGAVGAAPAQAVTAADPGSANRAKEGGPPLPAAARAAHANGKKAEWKPQRFGGQRHLPHAR